MSFCKPCHIPFRKSFRLLPSSQSTRGSDAKTLQHSPATQAITVEKNSFFRERDKHPLHFQNGDRKTRKRK